MAGARAGVDLRAGFAQIDWLTGCAPLPQPATSTMAATASSPTSFIPAVSAVRRVAQFLPAQLRLQADGELTRRSSTAPADPDHVVEQGRFATVRNPADPLPDLQQRRLPFRGGQLEGGENLLGGGKVMVLVVGPGRRGRVIDDQQDRRRVPRPRPLGAAPVPGEIRSSDCRNEALTRSYWPSGKSSVRSTVTKEIRSDHAGLLGIGAARPALPPTRQPRSPASRVGPARSRHRLRPRPGPAPGPAVEFGRLVGEYGVDPADPDPLGVAGIPVRSGGIEAGRFIGRGLMGMLWAAGE